MNDIIIYEENEKYYQLENNLYVEQMVSIKRHTISITPMPNGEVKTKLDNLVKYTFIELKEKLLGGM